MTVIKWLPQEITLHSANLLPCLQTGWKPNLCYWGRERWDGSIEHQDCQYLWCFPSAPPSATRNQHPTMCIIEMGSKVTAPAFSFQILKDSHRASCVYDFSQPFEPYVETCTSFYLSFGPKKLVNCWQAGSSVKTLILLLPRSSRSHRQTPPHQKPWDTVSLRCKSWFGLSRRLWWATDSFWNE